MPTPKNTLPPAIETMPSEDPQSLGAAHLGIAAPQMEINPLLWRSRNHLPVGSLQHLQHNYMQTGPSLTDISQAPQAPLEGFPDQSQLANTYSSFVRTPRGVSYFLSLGNNDAQQSDENLQDSETIQVAANLTDNVVRPSHLCAQGEALNLMANDTNHNNSDKPQIQAASVNNMSLRQPTNTNTLVQQSNDNQNLVENTNNTNVVLSQPFNTQQQNTHAQNKHNKILNPGQNYYPMASHLLTNLTFWHMPNLDM